MFLQSHFLPIRQQVGETTDLVFHLYPQSQQYPIQVARSTTIWFFHTTWASLVSQRLKRLHPMRETWVWSLGREDPLEKEMANHSNILAWRIPWMEELGRLQSKGSQRVGHDWATSLYFFKHLCLCANSSEIRTTESLNIHHVILTERDSSHFIYCCSRRLTFNFVRFENWSKCSRMASLLYKVFHFAPGQF